MATSAALVLTGSMGKGHDSVAGACEAAFSSRGVPTKTLDCVEMLGSSGSKAGLGLFRRMLDLPALYDGFHFSHLRSGSRLASVMEEASTRFLLPKLRREVPPEIRDALLVSVFPTGVAAAARLKAERADISTVAFCTDACAHRMWVHEGIDLYIVCSMLAANTVRRYSSSARLAVVPPPVMPAFFDAPTQAQARAELDIPKDAPCVLLMAGGWGLGPLAEIAEALLDAGYWVLAVAGMNQRLYSKLSELSLSRNSLLPFAMTDRVPDLMAAAGAVVTSPGQTCHEARVVGRRLVLLDVVPGHGRENSLHEIEHGGALACSPRPDSVVNAVKVMFGEQPELSRWPVDSAEEWEKHFFGALESTGLEPLS